MSTTTTLLAGTALLLVTLAVVVLLWRRERDAHAATRARLERLEADLDEARRPPAPGTGVERTVPPAVGPATQLRRNGAGSVLQASIDDLQAWAAEGRSTVSKGAAPGGTVTVFFSDIERSSELGARLGEDAYAKVLAAHDALVRSRVERHRGQVAKTTGGVFMVAFRDAEAACRAAMSIQRRLAAGRDHRLRKAEVAVRIGIHTGTAEGRDGDYGPDLATAARLGALAEGGQVLASRAVADALDDDAAVVLEPAGRSQLRGLPGTYEVFLVRARSTLALATDPGDGTQR